MKKLTKLSLLLLAAAVLGILVSVSQAAVVITTTASVGPPPTSPSYATPGYTGRVLSALSAGSDPFAYPVSAPYLYSTAPNPLHWGDLAVDSSGQSVWLGQVITDPTSPFYGEKGTAFYVNLKVVGDGIHKFSLNDIRYQITSTDPIHSLSISGSLAGLTYGVSPIIGVDYGPDGLVHTADDLVYDSVSLIPASIPVDWIIYSGVASAYDATNIGLGAVQDYVNSVAPFYLTITYTVNDGTGEYSSSQTRTIVPEPASLCILGIGTLALIRRRQRSRQQ